MLFRSRFGKLTSLYELQRVNSHCTWMFRCDCGVEKPIRVTHVIRGSTLSCSCDQYRNAGIKLTTHGLTYSPEYAAWTRMKTRCYNERDISYPNYGGRGIFVCERWLHSFDNFYSDMGKRPSSKFSLERINYNESYSPSNCTWATRIQQANNTRKNIFLSFGGKSMTIAQWARKFHINPSTLLNRKKRGWGDGKILSTPCRKYL